MSVVFISLVRMLCNISTVSEFWSASFRM